MSDQNPNQRPLTDEEFAQLTPEQLEALGLKDKEEAAPADFSGGVIPNPNHIRPVLDTDSPEGPTRLSQGASITEPISQGTPKMDISNPAKNQMELEPGRMQEASAVVPSITPSISSKSIAPGIPDIGHAPLNMKPNPLGDATVAPPISGGAAAPTSGAKPSITAPIGSPDYWRQRQDQLEWEKNNPWGSEHNHPGIAGKILHGLATAGNIAGAVVAPATEELIPGSMLNREVQASQARSGEAQAIENKLKEAQIHGVPGKSPEEQFMNDALHGQGGGPKVGADGKPYDYLTAHAAWKQAEQDTKTDHSTPEAETLHDLMAGDNGKPRINPDTKQPYSYLEAYNKVKESGKGESGNDFERYYSQKVKEGLADTAANREATFTEWSKNDPQHIAAQAQRDFNQAESGRKDLQSAYDKVRAPYVKSQESIDQKMEKLTEAERNLQSNTAPGQAVSIIQTISGMASGTGSGVRITQAEINSLAHARGISGDATAFYQKLADGGKPLTPEQVKQITGLVEDVRHRALLKSAIVNHTLDQMNYATTPQQVKEAETFARKALSALEKNPDATIVNGPDGTPIGYATPDQQKRGSYSKF